jgi:cytochrome b
MNHKVLVWDLPTRVFHWLLVISFTGAYLTAESERLQLYHLTLGYTLTGLIAFRLIWGVFGTRHAQFRSFLPSVTKSWQYALSLIGKAQAPHYVGHNPLGALAIYALLLLGIAVSVTGYVYLQEIGGDWMEEGHEVIANMMLALVGLHIVGVVISSVAHQENLIRGMIDGHKNGEDAQAIKSSLNMVGVLLLLAVAAFWTVAYFQPQAIGLVVGENTSSETADKEEDDD